VSGMSKPQQQAPTTHILFNTLAYQSMLVVESFGRHTDRELALLCWVRPMMPVAGVPVIARILGHFIGVSPVHRSRPLRPRFWPLIGRGEVR
jgi:hypothetical protein